MSFVQKITKKLRRSKMEGAPNNTDLVEAVVLLAQNAARRILAARSPTAITNSSGASTAGPVIAVPTGTKQTITGSNYAPRAAFNTAIATVDNAIAVLATYLNANVNTPLASADSITLNATGVVAVANTVAAITTALTGSDGTSDAAMLRSEMNAALSAARNNFATLLKAYNQGAAHVNAPTITDASGGKADGAFTLVAQTTAASTVLTANLASTDCAAVADANAALLALAKDVSYVANQIGASLLSSGVLSSVQSVLIVP